MTEDEMVGWHHRLNGHEVEQAPKMVKNREAWCAAVHGIFQARVLEWGAMMLSLWCWIRLLRVPWTARKPNQSILKEISPEYSLEDLMLKLKLQFFGHLMQITDSFEKTLMLGKIEGRRRRR